MQTNNDVVTEVQDVNRFAEAIVEETAPKFRELAVEPPQPPWRLRIEPPLEFDGSKYHELIFDFDAMIAQDFIRAERTFTHMFKPDKNETLTLPEMKHEYRTILAAQVANVPIGLIRKLPRRYYIPVHQQTLKACGSSLDEEKA